MIIYDSPYYGITTIGDSIMHYQVKGAKHGVRRWQNPDGSLTPAGRVHYGVGEARNSARTDNDRPSQTSGRYQIGSSSSASGVDAGAVSKTKSTKADKERDKSQKAELDDALGYFKRSGINTSDFDANLDSIKRLGISPDDDRRRGEAVAGKISKTINDVYNGTSKSKYVKAAYDSMTAARKQYSDYDKQYNKINPPPKKQIGFNANKKYQQRMEEWQRAKRSDSELNRLAQEYTDRESDFAGSILKSIKFKDNDSNRQRMRRLIRDYG